MVHIIAKPEGLRIKKDPVARYKLPGICGAITGCLVFIVGIGISIVGYSTKSDDDQRTAKALQAVGPILCIAGIVMLIAGFTYKYVMHHRYKHLRKEKYIVRAKSPRSARSRSARTIRRSPGDGSSQIVSHDMQQHLEELGVEIGESSRANDMYMISESNGKIRYKETEFNNDISPQMPKKTMDASKVKSSKPKSTRPKSAVKIDLEPHYEGYAAVNEAYDGPLPQEAPVSEVNHKRHMDLDTITRIPDEAVRPSGKKLSPIRNKDLRTKKNAKKKSPRTPRPISGAKQSRNYAADGKENTAENNNHDTKTSHDETKGGNAELISSGIEIPRELTNITPRSKYSRRETLALHLNVDVEDIPDLTLQNGVVMDVNRLPTIAQDEDEYESDF